MPRQYLAIDLKSFYASVECVARGLDPLTTHLVVADTTRTEKTICLAVSPSLKALGLPGRARLFEVIRCIEQLNRERARLAPRGRLHGSSFSSKELTADPTLAIDYIVAPPHMLHYLQQSTDIFRLYTSYIAPEDIHVYSIDEVFMDVTPYLDYYHTTAPELARRIIKDILVRTGITATAGIGTNLYLAKIAMDIVAKHIPADADGVRIAELDEAAYRAQMWTHTPLTDFWRVGKGYAKRLAEYHLLTMGDIARCSLEHEDILYKMFGVNAELLIDHAWGWEPCTIADIKAYRPDTNSISSGQVLSEPYPYDKARLVVGEMSDALSLELAEKYLTTDQIVLTVGYDVANTSAYRGELKTDFYGRKVPKSAHGSINLGSATASTREIVKATLALYDQIVDPSLSVRRMNVVANHIKYADASDTPSSPVQLDFFTDYAAEEVRRAREQAVRQREHRAQEAVLEIKRKYGKNAILRGVNYEKGATMRSRNAQIGGHRA